MTEDERIAVATGIVKELQDQRISFVDGVAILGMTLVLVAEAAQGQIQIIKRANQDRRRG